MVCMGFELGQQDGRRGQNHGAMAADFFLYCRLFNTVECK